MVRLARVVIPGIPHHVTQRGNGRARTFVGDAPVFVENGESVAAIG